jgi:EmrB/QacA subfamily drug resistance transporter
MLRQHGTERVRPAGASSARLWVLALAALASFMVILDMFVVTTALTSIRDHLGASLGDLEWTVNAYTLSFAVLLMTAAALGDRLGRRRVFAAGLTLFALSSAACALAPGPGALIAARTVQGAGAAAIMPTALALLNGAFPPARRGWAIGIYGSVTALAVVVGPVLGGAVTQGLGWRWIFWLNLPIAVVVVSLASTRVRESFGPGGKVDVPGLVLLTLAALGLVWALVRGNAVGWGSAETVGALAAGAAAVAGFTVWQGRARAPMLPMRLLRSRSFAAGNAATFFLNASMAGAVFLMPQFLQVAAGENPLGAGLRLLPWGVAPFLLAPLAGALADRIGERPLVVTGLVVQAAAMGWIAAVAAPGVGYLVLVVPMVLSGAGFAFAIPAVTRASTSTVPPADLGKASGAYATMRQLGGAFGVAILAAAFAATGSYASPQAFTNGFATAFAVAAIVAATGVVAAAALPRRQQQRAPAAPSEAPASPHSSGLEQLSEL